MAPSGHRGSHEEDAITEEQMVTILREADERSVPGVAKEHGVSAQTTCARRKHFGSLEVAGRQTPAGSSSRRTSG
jgi:hypothetical protein